ncbi:MAG TPA: hypothetical protein VFN21_01580 [Acidimicrobiales bacterium]|nr:hypothetical protein [Acidimicrobiales bacterium]
MSLADALGKLRGLAAYAERHAAQYQRIESVTMIDATLRVLDVTSPKVREAIAAATDAKSLFAGTLAADY